MIIWGVSILLTIFIVVYIYQKITNWLDVAKSRKIAKRGQRGEVKANRLLKKKGYKIIDYQPEFERTIYVDGKPIKIPLKPDFLVEKRGKTYIAEVKTGIYAPSIQNSATRRQLIEYALINRDFGTLLVDMENNKIYEVDFRI